jgi:AcrR family transcriptional regulator
MPEIVPYAKGRAKREELLKVALDVFSRDEYASATLADIAREAGVTRSTLLYHFNSREELYTAVIKWRDEVNREHLSLDEGMLDGFVRLARYNEDVPGAVRLFTSLSSEAASARHAAHPYFKQRYGSLVDALTHEVEAKQKEGKVTDSIDAKTLARIYVALLDGMQLQRLYDSSADMGAAMEAIRYLITAAPDKD